ncbi:hypothetical protein V492_05469, partial [Pseudogymnoascus sp. VKM F-4246]
AVTTEREEAAATLPKESVASDIGDISPGTIPSPAKQTEPVVTTGVASGVVPETSASTGAAGGAGVGSVAPATPAKDTPTANTAATKAAAAQKESPASGSPSASAAGREAQQKKRRSFFGKLKDKLKDL